MAAEKLTRGRFAQIIIMLTLLITAFIWRTITFSEANKIDCSLQTNCTFTVKDIELTANRTKDGLLINKPATEWEIAVEEGAAKVTENAKMWVVKTSELDSFEVTIIDESQQTLAKVKF